MNLVKYSVSVTDDGSTTVIDSIHKEHFHSTFGAIAESQFIFINRGFKTISKQRIRILEVGFGTGLNCILTLLNKEQEQKIWYHTIEKYPLPKSITDEFNYYKLLNISPELFRSMHSFKWNKEAEFVKDFTLHKIHVDVAEYMPEEKYDIIYFDAFSYNVQPELWSLNIFKKMFMSLCPEGLLVTYSAKGEVKRALRDAGFKVKRISGPPGKRHILQAFTLLLANN